MTPPRLRRFLPGCAAVFLLLFLVALDFFVSPATELSLRNDSASSLTRIEVSVPGDRVPLGELAPRARTFASLHPNAEVGELDFVFVANGRRHSVRVGGQYFEARGYLVDAVVHADLSITAESRFGELGYHAHLLRRLRRR